MGTNIIITAKSNAPFARVTKSMLDDPNISWQAKGILSYLLGKPEEWKLRVRDLANRARNGETAIRTALKELREFGYAKLTPVRDERGKIVEWNWRVSDAPIFRDEPPDGDFPQVEIAHPNKNYSTKNELTEEDSRRQTFSRKPDWGEGSCKVFAPTWKPRNDTKEEQLATICPPNDYPSEKEFDDFLTYHELDHIMDKRPDLYWLLCTRKWHHWNGKRWRPIKDWEAYVLAFNEKIDEATRQPR
jgi:hypothetical protein